MSGNWVEDFGFTAVDDVTYRKQVIEEEESKVEKPALAAKEDIASLETRLEKKLDSIRNMEKKVDSLLKLIYDNEDIVEERKQLADSVANQKVKRSRATYKDLESYQNAKLETLFNDEAVESSNTFNLLMKSKILDRRKFESKRDPKTGRVTGKVVQKGFKAGRGVN